jgi:hypothetical protein
LSFESEELAPEAAPTQGKWNDAPAMFMNLDPHSGGGYNNSAAIFAARFALNNGVLIMKQVLISAVLLALAFFAFGFSPQAKAADGGPIDCSNGCTIVTCDGVNCMVWACDSSGCRIIGSYQRPVPPTRPKFTSQYNDKPQAFDKVCDASSHAVCAIKVCREETCNISAYDGKDFVHIAETDNIDYLLQHAGPRFRM